jgi:hypothetical protein
MSHSFSKTSCFIQSLLLLVATLIFSSTLQAQSVQGSIQGTVSDKQDRVIPGASVTLTNLDEGTVRTTKSGDNGSFRFIDVKAAHYTVDVSSTGFGTSLRPTSFSLLVNSYVSMLLLKSVACSRR